jgi:DMSO reductase family type II enzyme chaperone
MEIVDTKLDKAVGEIDLALCRATLYSALALGFRPPSKEAIARLTEPDNAAALSQAAAIVAPEAMGGFTSDIETISQTGRVGVANLAASYRALFGHIARGLIPPYETEYGNEALFQQPHELGDLMGFYRAFGLTVNLITHERPDHISCECEFLSFLTMKEAYALEHGDAEMLHETQKAQRLFLKHHLGRFLPTFATKVSREEPAGFYSALAEFSLRFVTHESARLKLPLGGVNLPLRPADDDRVPMACGSGAECAAMPGACAPEGDDSI